MNSIFTVLPILQVPRKAALLILCGMLGMSESQAIEIKSPVWTFEGLGTVFGSPAIGPNGEIVVGTEETNTESNSGKVYSFNPNGTVRWVYTGADWFDSSPAIASDGTVYIGCWDNYLYALDGDSFKTSPDHYLWRFPTDSIITATPTIGPDGTIYVGSHDGILYAISPPGFNEAEPTEKWRYDSTSPIEGGTVLNDAGNTLYFGNEDGQLHAVDTATGNKVWSFQVPAFHDLLDKPYQRAIYSAPLIDSTDQVYFGCENGRLYELSSTGTLSDSFPAEDSILCSPIMDALGRLFFASQDGYLYAVASDGDLGGMIQLWEVFVGDILYCTPAMDDNSNIIIAGYSGSAETGNATTVFSVSLSGVVQWSFSFPTLNDSSPNIAPDGSIYIGAHENLLNGQSGKLYKFQGGAPLAQSGWPRFGSNRRQTGWIDDLFEPDLVDYFPDIEYNLLNLSYVPWFGQGFIEDAGLPLVRHTEHGEIWMAQSSEDGVIFYDYVLASWIFAPSAAPNYGYLLNGGYWIYHAMGTSVQTGRWFYSYQTSSWVGDSELN
jgi:outer membrane protein assembly factor BamB